MEPQGAKAVLERAIVEADYIVKDGVVGVLVEYNDIDVTSRGMDWPGGMNWAPELPRERAPCDLLPLAVPIKGDITG